MKKICCILILVLATESLFAQMDEKFYFPDKEWIGIDSLNYEEIILQVDNDTVYSYLIKPDTPPKATILYFHGNGSNVSKWIGHVQPLVKNGFQVCMFDYRGYGKSSGKPTHLNIACDAQLLFDTILQHINVKNTAIIVYGASIGSQIATHLTKNNNEKISALVLDGMMASFTDIALLSSPKEYHNQIKQYVTSPYSAKEDIKHISNVKVLFIHSKEDPIPISGMQSVYDVSDCPKTLWIYEGKHIEAPIKHTDTFVKYMNDLL